MLALLLCAGVFWGVVAGLASFGARGSSDPSRLRPLLVAEEAASSAAGVGVLFLRPCRRGAAVSSCGSAGLVRRCAGGGWGPASPAGRGGEGRCGSVRVFCCACSGTLLLRVFSGRPWRRGGEAPGGGVLERMDAEVAAVGCCGLQFEDLATSAEVEWRWPRIWSGRSSGCVPGRWAFIVSSSSSSDLVYTAALQSFRAWSSSVSWRGDPGGGSLRRPRRWWPRASGDLEVEDGVRQQFCSLFFISFLCACIWLCNGSLYV